MIHSVPHEVVDALEAAAREGRAIQGAWRRAGDRGQELVGPLAAFGANINSPSDCPTQYMPRWLAELIPELGDGIPSARISEFFLALASSARQWQLLDAAAWERARAAFLCVCVQQALEAAAALQGDPKPPYWKEIEDVCAAVLAGLRGDGDLAVAAERAWPWAMPEGKLSFVLDAPSEATWAAKSAAEAAYAATAKCVSAGKEAAMAAAGVAWGDQAAHAAAHWSLARGLFSLLNTEIAAAKGFRPHLEL